MLLFQDRQLLVRQRRFVAHCGRSVCTFDGLRHRGCPDLGFGDGAPGFATSSRDEPRVKPLRRLDVVQFLKESGKYILKDLSRLIFVEAGTKGNGVDETLVASYQFLPSKLISTSACQHQLQVTVVHLYQGFPGQPE